MRRYHASGPARLRHNELAALLSPGYIEIQDRYKDEIVRRMLERWVSGLEPVIAYDYRHNIIGLSIAGIPHGAEGLIVIRVEDVL